MCTYSSNENPRKNQKLIRPPSHGANILGWTSTLNLYYSNSNGVNILVWPLALNLCYSHSNDNTIYILVFYLHIIRGILGEYLEYYLREFGLERPLRGTSPKEKGFGATIS
jgi:hypothetical protein